MPQRQLPFPGYGLPQHTASGRALPLPVPVHGQSHRIPALPSDIVSSRSTSFWGSNGKIRSFYGKCFTLSTIGQRSAGAVTTCCCFILHGVPHRGQNAARSDSCAPHFLQNIRNFAPFHPIILRQSDSFSVSTCSCALVSRYTILEIIPRIRKAP